MALKFKYATKAEIPAEQVSFYAERDGAFVLDAEGIADKNKLDEFRTNNLKLIAERDALKAKFEGVDLDALKKADEERKRLEAELLGKNTEVDKVVLTRLKPLQDALAALTAEKETADRQLRETQINQAAIAAASKRGLRASAHEDLITRAARAMKLENGAPVIVDISGNKRFRPDAVTPMTLDDWAESLVSDAPHLFETNAGGGASGNGSGGAANGHVNPWKKETFNLTQQGRIYQADPVRARQLAASVGVALT